MSSVQISSLRPICPGTACSALLDGSPDASLGLTWCPDRLVMAHFAPHEGHISRITQGASGACFAHPWRPSRTQKCDAYCHNFMRPRRSTRPAIVTDISVPSPVFPFQVPYSLNFYSRFFKFCRILFYVMHIYAEYRSKTHKVCIKCA